MMGPIKEALRETFFPTLVWGRRLTLTFRKILGHIIMCGGLGIPDPQPSTESAYKASKAASGELLGYLLGRTAINYVGHKYCVRKNSAGARKDWQHVEMEEPDR